MGWSHFARNEYVIKKYNDFSHCKCLKINGICQCMNVTSCRYCSIRYCASNVGHRHKIKNRLPINSLMWLVQRVQRVRRVWVIHNWMIGIIRTKNYSFEMTKWIALPNSEKSHVIYDSKFHWVFLRFFYHKYQSYLVEVYVYQLSIVIKLNYSVSKQQYKKNENWEKSIIERK